MKKKLPIGIQTFREIREDNHYYVGKTQLAFNLVEKGKHHFLSCPRRFGKSLFLDTLKELFEGNESLFQGLAAEKQWDCFFEFKVVEFVPEGKALQQIKDKGYADKYRSDSQPIHLIGVEFSKDNRNIVTFEVETA